MATEDTMTPPPHPAPNDVLAPLLTAIHEGVLEKPSWSTFVQRLRAALRTNAASFSFRLDDKIGPGVLAASPLPSAPAFDYVMANGLDAVGPPPGGNTLLPRRLYGVPDFLDRSIPEHVEFERKIMLPNRLTYMRVICIPEASGGKAWLAVGRDAGDFDTAEEALLTELIPHLEIALNTFTTIERERSRSGIAGDAVRKLDFCWLMLDSHCRIVDLDHHAENLLRRSASVRRTPRGQLVLADISANRAMAEAVVAMIKCPESRPRALHVADEPWLDMLIAPPRETSLIDMMEPRVVAYIHGEADFGDDRHDLLCDLFGLTARESSLVLALCRGQSIRQAAHLLNVTEATAREYTKRIYAKTGTRGQADLVRLILTSVVALA